MRNISAHWPVVKLSPTAAAAPSGTLARAQRSRVVSGAGSSAGVAGAVVPSAGTGETSPEEAAVGAAEGAGRPGASSKRGPGRGRSVKRASKAH